MRPEGEPREQGHMDTTPHVSNDRWYGHDRPDAKRYHMDHGFPHGRFERFGPGYRYNIVRIDHDHHELLGSLAHARLSMRRSAEDAQAGVFLLAATAAGHEQPQQQPDHDHADRRQHHRQHGRRQRRGLHDQ